MAQTPAHIRASAKYDAKAYDKGSFRFKKGKLDIIKKQAINQGLSLNAYIKKALTAQYKADTGEEINL